MKNRFEITTKRLTLLFGGTLLIGSLISAFLTTDRRWMDWHFSRLGEGGMFSSVIFNLTLVISAFLFFSLGNALNNEISQIEELSASERLRSRTNIRKIFSAVSACLLVVAAFPFDRFPVVHNIFGYSILFIFIYLCRYISKILPIYLDGFYYYGYGIILTTIICYVLFLAFQVISLLAVEFAIFALLYFWLIYLVKGVHQKAVRVPVIEGK